MGDLHNARQACRQAAELAEKLGDASALARAALGFSGPARFEVAAATTRPVADLLERALAALGEKDSALGAQLMGRLATYADDVHRRLVLAGQALEMARRVANKATLADVLASSLRATPGPDSLHESLAMTRELGRAADEVGDNRLRALAHGRLLRDLLEIGDIDGVERELEALQRLAEKQQERYVMRLLAGLRASQAYLGGRLEDCERLAHEALAHRFKDHDESAAHIFGTQMLFVRREQGRLDELVQNVEEFAEQYPQLVGYRCVLAYICAQLARRTQAHHVLEVFSSADFADLPRDALWLANLSMLSEVVFFLRDAPHARVLYNLLLPYADRCVIGLAALCQGSASRPLGLLATTLSRFDDAEQHFEDALTMNAQIKSPLWIAHTQHDYARMLLLRNHLGDDVKARQLLSEALDTAEELSLTALASTARALKTSAQATGTSRALPRPT